MNQRTFNVLIIISTFLFSFVFVYACMRFSLSYNKKKLESIENCVYCNVKENVYFDNPKDQNLYYELCDLVNVSINWLSADFHNKENNQILKSFLIDNDIGPCLLHTNNWKVEINTLSDDGDYEIFYQQVKPVVGERTRHRIGPGLSNDTYSIYSKYK